MHTHKTSCSQAGSWVSGECELPSPTSSMGHSSVQSVVLKVLCQRCAACTALHHRTPASCNTMSLSEEDTQLDQEEAFDAAADYLGHLVTSGGPPKLSDQHKLAFYGLYKQATAGDCSASKPGFWDPSGRAKWDAWNKRKGTSKEEAMAAYVELLTSLVPSWDVSASTSGRSHVDGSKKQQSSMGPVFSTLAGNRDDRQQAGISTLHEVAGQGDLDAVERQLQAGTSIDTLDEDGCTALHFAADRGQTDMLRALIRAGANINARDADGQTPLHYAALCSQLEACEVLLQAGADASLEDGSGAKPQDVGPQNWVLWYAVSR